MRIKFFKFWLVLIFPLHALAQTYPIPGAQQQPKWVFPFFMEDAHGRRDTVYLGYDTSATQASAWGDPQFGETWFAIDTNQFQGLTYYNLDSAINVDIRRTLSYPFSLSAINAYFPVKISWLVTLLHSDSIPYPDQNPLPRAQINVEWFLGPQEISPPTCGSNPFVISDTVLSTCPCQHKDSVVVYNLFGDTSKLFLDLILFIDPWSGTNLVGLSEYNSAKNISIYPVPANDFLLINASIGDFYEILTLSGTILRKGIIKSFDNKIITSDIPSGFYLVKIYDDKKIINRKIVIQH